MKRTLYLLLVALSISGCSKYGYVSLNIAVAYEVLGNTDNALDWAQKSYEYYDDKLGRSYAKILLRRKSTE